MLVIVEESYKITVWCREILDGLKQEARKKRVNLTFSSNTDDINAKNSSKAIMLVGSETNWLKTAVERVKEAGKHPIVLSNQSAGALGSGVSYVTEDLEGSMKEICNHFKRQGKHHLALYAVNPASASDECKKASFLASGGHIDDVFVNEGSLRACFNSFLARLEQNRYDGIICVNDFAAISLLRHMQKAEVDRASIDMISYSNTLISRCSSPAVSSVRANYNDFGQMAFMIMDCIGKSELINGIHIFGKWEIVHRETSSGEKHATLCNEGLTAKENEMGRFYGDPELQDLLQIEDLLSSCDKTDLAILARILDGKKHAEIAEACFLTETAVKYRIRKMKEICHCESRAALRDFLFTYVSDLSALMNV